MILEIRFEKVKKKLKIKDFSNNIIETNTHTHTHS